MKDMKNISDIRILMILRILKKSMILSISGSYGYRRNL